MVRYPHIAYLVVKTTSDSKGPVQDSDGNVIAASKAEIEQSKVQIKGRYEPNGQKSKLDYSAKFYTPIKDNAPFSIDGHYLEYEGMTFSIVQFHNYQKHCEIWLE